MKIVVSKKTKSKISSLIILILTLSLALVMAFSFCFGAIKSLATLVQAESLSSAKAMCVMEAESGRVLFQKNSNEKLAMASTTKIMTAITAIENAKDLDEVFEVSPKAIGVEGTSLYLRQGEKHSLRDLLYGLMLVSGNDASVAIGEKVGGTIEHFVDLMNFTAHKLGAKNTHFENTHGLDEKGHYTSAYDLAKIASYALKNPTFKEIVSTQNKKIVSESGKTRYLCNKNKLLRTFNGAIGVKTGFTDNAGRCLVSAAERDGMTIVCVVLNCGPMFEESANLLEQAFQKYKMVDLSTFVCLPNSVKVVEGEKENVKVCHQGEFRYPLCHGEEKQISSSFSLPDIVHPELEKGQEIGSFEIKMNNDLLFSGKIVTMEQVKARSLKQRFFDIVDQW